MEGEACFSSRSKGAPPRVRIDMTDKDVIERVARLLDRSAQFSHPPRSQARGWKPTWRVQISGAPALDLMQTFYPLLGERRRATIERVLHEEGVDFSS
jgi:hypothetical protein